MRRQLTPPEELGPEYIPEPTPLEAYLEGLAPIPRNRRMAEALRRLRAGMLPDDVADELSGYALPIW